MSFRQDLGYAFRTLRRSPGFSVAAIATLALGIGVNTAMFSIVNSVLLRPLPYRDADRLAFIWTTDPMVGAQQRSTGYRNIDDWRRDARSFEDMAVFREEWVVWNEEPEPEQMEACYASPNLFAELEVQPMLGRTFAPDDVERPVVLSYELWQRRFGGARDAIGKVVRIDGRPSEVIGVMPAGFRPLSAATRLWMPDRAFPLYNEIREYRIVKFGWAVIARLRPGVRVAEAQAEMNGIAARLAAAYPDPNRGRGARVVTARDQVVGAVRLALEILLAAVAAVLLIACTNLGNLALARAAGRAREVAIRAALGAGRARLAAQFFTESAVLALAAGALGVLLAAAGLRAILSFAPKSLPRVGEISLDSRAILFTFGASLLSAVLFGLVPALRLAAGSLATGARAAGSGRPARRTRDLLVMAECALAILLLTGAGLLVRSMAAVLHIDPGFRASSVLTVEFHSPIADDAARFGQLVARLESLPGVLAAGGISRYFQVNSMREPVRVGGRPPLDAARAPEVNYDVMDGHFLQAVGAPLLRGRYFSDADGPNSPKVALVNQAFVDAFLTGEDPIGKTFRRGADPTDDYRIVGVIGDMRRRAITSDPIPEVLWPHSQRPWSMALAVRTAGDPLALAPTVRRTLHELDRSAVIRTVTTLDRQLDERVAERRFQTWLLGAFALMALALAAIGIYSLMHYAVAERTREIGVRMALGARPRDIFDLVLGHAAMLVGVGMAAGVAGALWLTRALASLLYGVSAHDPATYAAVAVLLFGAAMLAGAIPAARATRSDPLASLRQE